MRRDDRITFYNDQDEVVYEAFCEIGRVRPDETDVTSAAIQLTHSMVLTLRYSQALEPIIATPSKHTYSLDRRPEVDRVTVVSVVRSEDRRHVIISL